MEADPGRYTCAAFIHYLPKSEIVLKEKEFHFREKNKLFQNRSILFTFTGLSRKKPHSLRLSLYYTALLFVSTAKTEKFAASSVKSREIFAVRNWRSVPNRKRCRYFYCPHDKQQLRSFGKPTPYNHVFFCFNTAYNHLFYDILKMPVSTRNRVSMNAAQSVSGISDGNRYIQTTENRLPAGYVPASKGNMVLAENPNVLCPLLTEPQLLSEADYDTLDYPYNLDTLTNQMLFGNCRHREIRLYFSDKEYALPQSFMKRSSDTWQKPYPQSPFCPERSRFCFCLLMWTMGTRDIDITINVETGFPVPTPLINQNHTFTYVLSANTPLKTLEIAFSEIIK